MAGSPIKRARKAGLPIPKKDPNAKDVGVFAGKGAATPQTRARAREEPLPGDAELGVLGRRVLRELALEAGDERVRATAAQALVMIARVAVKDSASAPKADLDTLTDEELASLAAKEERGDARESVQ